MHDFFMQLLNGASSFLKRIFGKEGLKQAAAWAKVAGDIGRYALPVAEVMAKFTATKTDDNVVALAKRFLEPGALVGLDLSKPLAARDVENILFDCAGAALRGDLASAFDEAGSAGLAFGGYKFKSLNAIPDSIIDSAVQDAYTAFHNATRPLPGGK